MGLLALAAVGYAVLATPVPRVWHAQMYAAQELLPEVARRFDQGFRQMALEAQRLQRGEIRQPVFLQNAERAIGPACSAITEELAPLRVPRWEQTGRLVHMYLQICALTTRSLALEQAMLRRDPGLPADAAAQLAQLSGQMQLALRELADAVRRAPVPVPVPVPRKPARAPQAPT